MWMYDATGGVRIGKLHKRISNDEALQYMPTLPVERLAGSYVYYDAQTDDARLTLAVARTAADHGAMLANYASVTGLTKDASRARARRSRASPTATRSTCGPTSWSTRRACGPTSVRAFDEGGQPVVDPAREGRAHHRAVVAGAEHDRGRRCPVPKDRRSVFVVPWGDFTYIGTTDTDYDGPIDDPQCTPDDIEYLLRAINFSVTTTITEADIVGTWAGLRPSSRDATSERTVGPLASPQRPHVGRGGLITVTGGKLTTYRRMAADTVDAVEKRFGAAAAAAPKRIALRGAKGWKNAGVPGSTSSSATAATRARSMALANADPTLREPLVPGLPYWRAEAVYAARHEMARTVDDVLSRRTRARLLARDASAEAAAAVAALIGRRARLVGDEQQQREAEAYRAAVEAERARLRPP